MLLHLLPRHLRRRFMEQPILWQLITSLLVLALVCTGFLLTLRAVESLTWMESLWQVWQTVTTVGYGNHPSETPAGRVVTMTFGLVGIAVLGTAITAFFDWRSDLRQREFLGEMNNPFKNGYLVINFPGVPKFTALATELAAGDDDRQVEICVVDSQLEQLPTSILHLPRVRVHFIRGSLLKEETYRRAGVERSEVVMVFPQQTGIAESDATTKMVVEIVNRLTTEKTRIAHILVAPENGWLFEGLRSTAVLEIDEILVLVQECHDPMTAVMLQSLLRVSNGINPRTVKPEKIVGWTWAQFQQSGLQLAAQENQRFNPLALFRNGVPDACPPPNTTIERGDFLSIIVGENFDWERFESVLAREGSGK